MIKVSKCPICNSKNLINLKEFTFKSPVSDNINHLMDANYVRLWIFFKKILRKGDKYNFTSNLCNNCGFIFLNPRFSEKEFEIKYNAINKLGSVKYRLKRTPEYNLKNRANRVYKLINKYFNYRSKEKPKILDYGGASGYILTPFIKKFECSVLDYQKWKLSEGVKCIGKDLRDLKETDKFDIILLLHTLEHVTNPKEFLINILNRLNQNGIIYIEVPLGCFYEWQNIGNPITHVNFFSEESLFKCLRFNGLNVLDLNTANQWVTHSKSWCLNIIGTKKKRGNFKFLKEILSTRAQMSRPYFYYYLLISLIYRILRFNPKNFLNLFTIFKQMFLTI